MQSTSLSIAEADWMHIWPINWLAVAYRMSNVAIVSEMCDVTWRPWGMEGLVVLGHRDDRSFINCRAPPTTALHATTYLNWEVTTLKKYINGLKSMCKTLPNAGSNLFMWYRNRKAGTNRDIEKSTRYTVYTQRAVESSAILLCYERFMFSTHPEFWLVFYELASRQPT